jgi:ABC-type spermidine/putrescine transport system permease subunit II
MCSLRITFFTTTAITGLAMLLAYHLRKQRFYAPKFVWLVFQQSTL